MKQRQRRGGFTLVELLITCALIVLILAIITQAFVIGLDSLGRLKSSGDLADRMRLVSNILRADLRADHFDGSLRLSDAHFGTTIPNVIGTDRPSQQPATLSRRPAMGFFQVKQHGGSVSEGLGPDGVDSVRAPSVPGKGHVLYMTVKLRGNAEKDFFSAHVPKGSPVLGFKDTTYFDQPTDARRQSPKADDTLFSSQWAEVAYYLRPRVDALNNQLSMARDTPLYSLHRKVRLLVPRNDKLANLVSKDLKTAYGGLAWRISGNFLSFKTPQDVISLAGRSMKEDIIDKDPSTFVEDATLDPDRETMLLSDVVSFTVQIVTYQPAINPLSGIPSFASNPLQRPAADISGGNYDTNVHASGLLAVVITIRCWDSRTEQTRQITIIEDL